MDTLWCIFELLVVFRPCLRTGNVIQMDDPLLRRQYSASLDILLRKPN
jgi:hypothetical protein